MKVRDSKHKGFTILELLVTMGIFAVLTSLATINLLGAQHIASIDTTVSTLIADLKQQQIKAMTGDTEGRTAGDQYGIHFETNKYVLFHGTYNSTDNSNFPVSLDGTLSFTNISDGGNIIFSQGSGESSGLSTITLKDTATNKQKVFSINIYGVVTDVN